MANARSDEKKSRGPFMETIEEGYLLALYDDSIWEKDEAEIKRIVSVIREFKATVKKATDKYDAHLNQARLIKGEDYLKEVPFFRNPRTTEKKVEVNPFA